MPASFTITVPTPVGPVDVAVERKRVKNLNLRVHRDGSVSLSIPHRAPRATAEGFLARRAGWIAEHLVRARMRRERDDGQDPGTIPLWGKTVPHDGSPAEERYRTAMLERLPEAARRAEERSGIHAARWQVRIMKTRWGSCTPGRRSIRINGMLAAYPPACLDYVCLHELAHIMEPSHNARFHRILDGLLPENRVVARLLRQPAREIAREA